MLEAATGPTIHALNYRAVTGRSKRYGRAMRERQLYRCGELTVGEVVAGSRAVDHAFARVVDLRYAPERQRNPSPWPADWADRIVVPKSEGEQGEAPHMTLPDDMHDAAAMRAFFGDLYRGLPFEPIYFTMFARAVRTIADAPGPVLIHCTGGKDRTGILVALIQHMLGFSRADIVAEYLRTNDSPDLVAHAPQLAERLRAAGSHNVTLDLVRRIIRVDETYLAAAFAAIEARCGSIDGYLAMIGLDEGVAERLRATLLE